MAVANVWAAPGTATISDSPSRWSALSYAQRIALVGHMPTQALLGERVVVLARRGAWTKIAIPDQPSPLDRRGYPGWVKTSQLNFRSLPPEPASVIVTVPFAELTPHLRISFATKLRLDRRLGRVDQVLTPAVSWIPATSVTRLPRTRADLVRTAKLFVGLPYLWGGLSAWGYDCSGLTWAVYRAHGITIPRDADAQFAAGRPVALADAQPGDLVFYEHPVGHVAMLIGDGEMIESPNSASVVRIVPIRSGYVGLRTYL